MESQTSGNYLAYPYVNGNFQWILFSLNLPIFSDITPPTQDKTHEIKMDFFLSEEEFMSGCKPL